MSDNSAPVDSSLQSATRKRTTRETPIVIEPDDEELLATEAPSAKRISPFVSEVLDDDDDGGEVHRVADASDDTLAIGDDTLSNIADKASQSAVDDETKLVQSEPVKNGFMKSYEVVEVDGKELLGDCEGTIHALRVEVNVAELHKAIQNVADSKFDTRKAPCAAESLHTERDCASFNPLSPVRDDVTRLLWNEDDEVVSTKLKSNRYFEMVMPINRYVDTYLIVKFVDEAGEKKAVSGEEALFAVESFLQHALDEDYVAVMRTWFSKLGSDANMDAELVDDLTKETPLSQLRRVSLLCDRVNLEDLETLDQDRRTLISLGS